jgi:hypothetical protein
MILSPGISVGSIEPVGILKGWMTKERMRSANITAVMTVSAISLTSAFFCGSIFKNMSLL